MISSTVRFTIGLLVLALMLSAGVALGQTLTVMHTFTGSPDGSTPYGGVVRDAAGNLYGTTTMGGSAGYGTVFKLDTSGHETVLHSFTGGSDGASPYYESLVLDAAGNLYGTTALGGLGYGTVFKVDTSGTETVLHSFTAAPDGANPYGGLVMDAVGSLYGTTVLGGAAGGSGTVFKVDTSGNETVLYSFTRTDGANPYGSLVIDAAGTLYGTTEAGGASGVGGLGYGTVFKVDTSGNETVLYSFTAAPDGANPYGGLAMDAAGNLYGTTFYGGTGACSATTTTTGCGTVFKVNTSGQEAVLYSFTNSGGDGGFPHAGLVMDAAGNLYGTTEAGGASVNAGTVFEVDTSGHETVLHRFNGVDGAGPFAGLVMDAAATNFYGTTAQLGGLPGFGTVFKLSVVQVSTGGKDDGVCEECQKKRMIANSSPVTSTGRAAVGLPINIATGNMYEQVTDYITVGTNPLALIRTYNSLSYTRTLYPTLIGTNWRTNYDRYLRVFSSSLVAAERPDGRVINFNLVSGVWTPDTDVDLKLTNSGSSYTLTDSDDTAEAYTVTSGKGTLISIAYRNGYTQTMHYTGAALTSVSDSYSRPLGFTYTNGVLTQVTTPDSLILTYGYTATAGASLLTSVAYNTSPATSQTYLYENTAQPFALTGIIDENHSRYATWTYDVAKRATSSQHAGGAGLTQLSYDDSTGNRTITNALGQQEVYKFTTLQGVPKVIEIDRLATATTAAATMRFTYDANGYAVSQTDWNGIQTAYTRDVRGQPTNITEAVGTPQARTTALTYHTSFHLPLQTVTPGLTTDFTYDSSGNLLTRTLTDTTTTTVPYSTNGAKRTWTYTWGANGLLLSAKGPRTDVSELTTFSYDASGTLIQTTNARGQIVKITQHTPGGLPQTIVDPNNVTTQLAYDGRLRLASSAVNTAAGALTTHYAYDAAGNLTGVTLPDGSALANTYDAAHRLTGVADLFGQKTAWVLDSRGDRTLVNVTNAANTITRTRSDSFDALGRLVQDTRGAGQNTSYSYDGNGNAVTINDPLSRPTTRAFDALNRLFQATDPANGIATTSFDAHDRPLTVTAPNGAVTTYVYDGFGDLIQTTSPDTGTTVYHYDLTGNLTQKVDTAGETATYTYDALDRVLTTTYPADAAENVAYTYDQTRHGFTFGIGRLTSVTDAAGKLTRSYDERGNVLTESRVHGRVTLATSYRYDAASRIVSVTYPSGAIAAYARDAMGRIITVNLTPPKKKTSVAVASSIAYQPFGPVNALTFGNGVAAARSFDLDYRITSLTDGSIQNLGYSYDAADDVLSIVDAVHSANTQNFGHDTLDRLTTAAGLYGSLAYTYDSSGNRLTQQAGAIGTAYSYAPQSNRLTSIATGTTTQAVGTTAAGNINSFSPAFGAVTNLTYNQAGRLATASSGSGQLIQYSYDAFGQRIVKVGSATATTLFQYDRSGHLLEQTDVSGNAQVDYIYLDDRPLATYQPSNGKMYFLHDDRLGTPQAATDSTQAVVWNANYEPFGFTSTGAAGIVQNLRLPGQEFEIETGINHNGFRDYAPTLGRYLESDPIGLAGGLNTYAYVQGNPVKSMDFSGLQLFIPGSYPFGTFPTTTEGWQSWQSGQDLSLQAAATCSANQEKQLEEIAEFTGGAGNAQEILNIGGLHAKIPGLSFVDVATNGALTANNPKNLPSFVNAVLDLNPIYGAADFLVQSVEYTFRVEPVY